MNPRFALSLVVFGVLIAILRWTGLGFSAANSVAVDFANLSFFLGCSGLLVRALMGADPRDAALGTTISARANENRHRGEIF